MKNFNQSTTTNAQVTSWWALWQDPFHNTFWLPNTSSRIVDFKIFKSTYSCCGNTILVGQVSWIYGVQSVLPCSWQPKPSCQLQLMNQPFALFLPFKAVSPCDFNCSRDVHCSPLVVLATSQLLQDNSALPFFLRLTFTTRDEWRWESVSKHKIWTDPLVLPALWSSTAEGK